METTTNWRQIGGKLIFRDQTKTWKQTGDSEPIKGLSQLALSLSLSSTFLLEGPGHTTSPTLGIIHNCTIPNFTIPEIFLCPGIKHTCTIPKNIPKSRNQTWLYHSWNLPMSRNQTLLYHSWNLPMSRNQTYSNFSYCVVYTLWINRKYTEISFIKLTRISSNSSQPHRVFYWLYELLTLICCLFVKLQPRILYFWNKSWQK